MDASRIESFFTRSDGSFLFARWGRPIAPVVFGVNDATLSVVKGAVEAVVALAGHRMTDMDPELGANMLVFFFRDWDELAEVPDPTGSCPRWATGSRRWMPISTAPSASKKARSRLRLYPDARAFRRPAEDRRLRRRQPVSDALSSALGDKMLNPAGAIKAGCFVPAIQAGGPDGLA